MRATAITGVLLIANLGTCITSVAIAEPWVLMICIFLFIPLSWANGFAMGRGAVQLRSPFTFGSAPSPSQQSRSVPSADRAAQRRRKAKPSV